jgi:hypothetical protein
LRIVQGFADEYVSIEQAAKDYGVVVKVVDRGQALYEVDGAASLTLREEIRAVTFGLPATGPAETAARHRTGNSMPSIWCGATASSPDGKLGNSCPLDGRVPPHDA